MHQTNELELGGMLLESKDQGVHGSVGRLCMHSFSYWQNILSLLRREDEFR